MFHCLGSKHDLILLMYDFHCPSLTTVSQCLLTGNHKNQREEETCWVSSSTLQHILQHIPLMEAHCALTAPSEYFICPPLRLTGSERQRRWGGEGIVGLSCHKLGHFISHSPHSHESTQRASSASSSSSPLCTRVVFLWSPESSHSLSDS